MDKYHATVRSRSGRANTNPQPYPEASAGTFDAAVKESDIEKIKFLLRQERLIPKSLSDYCAKVIINTLTLKPRLPSPHHFSLVDQLPIPLQVKDFLKRSGNYSYKAQTSLAQGVLTAETENDTRRTCELLMLGATVTPEIQILLTLKLQEAVKAEDSYQARKLIEKGATITPEMKNQMAQSLETAFTNYKLERFEIWKEIGAPFTSKVQTGLNNSLLKFVTDRNFTKAHTLKQLGATIVPKIQTLLNQQVRLGEYR